MAAPATATDTNRTAIDECDRLTASADDPDRPLAFAGIKLETIDARAVQACRVAIVVGSSASGPGAAIDRRRLHFELGQALQAAGTYGKAQAANATAAAAGSSSAMSNLGALYENGLGVARNVKAAKTWYERAAAAGNSDSMTSLGTFYAADENYAAAKGWYEKAVATGNASAMFNLGIMDAEGQGVPRDYSAARDWWEKAAAVGSVDAMFNLGVLHSEGLGVGQDYVAARV